MIIKATVMRLDMSNEPTVPAGPGLAVARVEAVYQANPHFGNLVGQEITIRFAEGQPTPAAGEQAIFYAADWVYGTHIVVQELARRPASSAAERSVGEEIANLPLSHLQDRVDGAQLAVVGAVERIEDSPLAEPLSYNAPQWAVAVVDVETVLKALPGPERQPRTVRVLFPRNDDWQAPQFTVRQTGIFMLRRLPDFGIPPEFFTALDSADCQPSDALDRVRSFLPRQGRKS
jgi:hypothetical protein